jgi:hypothetical protein
LKEDGFALSVSSGIRLSVCPESVSFLVANDAKSDQVLGRVMAKAAPRLDVMDLKAFDLPAPLATPSVPLEDFTAELAISFMLRLSSEERLVRNKIAAHSSVLWRASGLS